jgi:hypothetical protein
MQCPNCQFENMPGTAHCGRCAMVLSGPSNVLTVDPPRASRWAKRMRPYLPRAGYYAMRDRLQDSRDRWQQRLVDDAGVTLPSAGVLVRMIVPGWAHRRAGFGSRGLIFFAAYVVLLSVAILCLGSPIGMAALGFAFAFHSSSIIDLLYRSAPNRTRDLVAATLLLIAGLYGAYYGAARVASNWVLPRRIAINNGPFAAGDIVISNPRAYTGGEPVIGDVVAYNIRRTPVTLARNRILNVVGERIDRIIAGPGSTVDFDGTTLLVDGRPSEHLPLVTGQIPKGLSIQVPPTQYCILPSTDAMVAGSGNMRAWTQVCCVPATSIVGKVYLRHYPLWRWWWIG